MSGKGKSKLLEWCLYQDIAAGRGCGLIDPHSLLVDDLLRLLITRGVLADPDIRHRLIYVDPARTDYVIPFNVLATQAEHPYDIAAAVLEVFRRTWPECLKEAPHFSNVVTAALIVLIENGLTLMHMPRLLTNAEFREQCLERVTDASIVEFFHDRYDRCGREAPVMRESTLNKIGAFSLNPRLQLMLGQKANHLDFRAIMDEGKILLLDLGRSDGETNRLIGSLVVTGLEMAMRRRRNRRLWNLDRAQHELFSSPPKGCEQWVDRLRFQPARQATVASQTDRAPGIRSKARRQTQLERTRCRLIRGVW
jgi:hypothetical protein